MTTRSHTGLFVTALLGILPVAAAAQQPGASPQPLAAIAALSDPARTGSGSEEETETTAPLRWRAWSHATGDWSRVRERLETRGLALGLSTISDLSAIQSRTAADHGVARLFVDVNATIGLEQLAGIRGGTAFVQFYTKVGGDGAGYAGDLQGFSNIDGPSFARIGEVWYEQTFRDGLRVKGGRVDANVDFAAVESAADFINSSMGNSPTIVMFPTYPSPRLGLVASAAFSGHFEVAAGAYDDLEGACSELAATTPHAFVIGEVRSRWAIGGRLPGRATAGLWRHTGHVRPADGAPASIAQGPLAVVEQALWYRAGTADGAARHLTVFAQYGSAAGVIDAIGRHFGAGIVWRGPSAKRPDDVLGIAATSVALAAVAASEAHVSETSAGVFYKRQLTPWLAAQPDVQYIVHPGGDPARRPVLATTGRLVVEW